MTQPSPLGERQIVIIDKKHQYTRYGWYYDDPNIYVQTVTDLVPNWESFHVQAQRLIGGKWVTVRGGCGMVRTIPDAPVL